MTIRKRIRRTMIAVALTATTVVATAAPARAADSGYIWLDWGDRYVTSAEIPANAQHNIKVRLVPDGDNEASWRVWDTYTFQVVGKGTLSGSTPKVVQINGLYGRYKMVLSCSAVFLPTCTDGGKITS